MAVNFKRPNLVMGRGRVFFAPHDAEGVPGGEVHLGDTPGFAIQIEGQRVDAFGSEGPTRELIESVVVQVDRTATLTVRDIKEETVELFVGGETETVSQTATPVVAEVLGGGEPLVGGRYYQLGRSETNPSGVRGVTSVVVEKAPSTTFVLGTDYRLDADRGLVEIIKGGALDGEDEATVDYTPVANARRRTKTTDLVGKRGSLTFRADNKAGENRDLFAPIAELSPNGELTLKSDGDEWVQMGFDIKFIAANGLAALYIDGAPYTA